jgi:hypothetical protein
MAVWMLPAAEVVEACYVDDVVCLRQILLKRWFAAILSASVRQGSSTCIHSHHRRSVCNERLLRRFCVVRQQVHSKLSRWCTCSNCAFGEFVLDYTLQLNGGILVADSLAFNLIVVNILMLRNYSLSCFCN